MKKLFLFTLLMSYTGLQIAAERKSHSVERYSPLTERVMYCLASSNSLRDFTRHRRDDLHQRENNSHTELFQNAQREIGIADQDILPVKMLSRDDSEDKKGYACTTSSVICVIPENFDQLPYGAQRITALHESFHNKYHDSAFEAWLFFKLGGALIGTTTITTAVLWKLINSYVAGNKLRVGGYLAAPIVSFAVNVVTYAKLCSSIRLGKSQSAHDYYKEFRADRDAVSHANCYKCIEEYSTMAGPAQYLTKDELQVYIDQFKKEDAFCDHHHQ